MDTRDVYEKVIKRIAPYLLATILCIIILVLVMRLWEADLSVPFTYTWDATWALTTLKTIQDTGWYLHSGFLGMPFGQDMYDFAQAHNLDMLIQKALIMLTQNYAVTINLYFLLTFPLTVITSMLAMRQFKLSYPSCIVGSLLFTFVPYHFLQGLPHLVLSSYFMLPLMVVVLYWVYSGRLSLSQNRGKGKPLSKLVTPELAASVVICALTASTYIYYSFFSILFLAVVGVTASLYRKSKWPLVIACLLVAIMAIVVVINVSPTIVYQLENGKNALVAVRSPVESETYGLKIFQLLLPVEGHRIPLLTHITALYDANAPLVNENSMAALGMIGSAGFVLLILWMFYRGQAGALHIDEETGDRLNCLGVMNLAAVLVATIGGFGEIVAASVMPEIRCYNRISIFIAFFSLLAVLILLELIYDRYVKGSGIKYSKALFCIFLALLLVFGVFDQTTDGFVPQYASMKQEFMSDQHFVDKIEATVPPGSMIFQLPYVPFPENMPLYNNMQDYALFRGYLHSTDLRWSYGAMKGRPADAWQKAVSGEPPGDMIRTLSFAGFNGIYVDSYGYADGGSSITAQLTQALGTPIVSENGRLYFFSMVDYNKRLQGNYTSAEWDEQKNEVLAL